MPKKVEVFKCNDHGEFELMDRKDTSKPAYCTDCGKESPKVGEYIE